MESGKAVALKVSHEEDVSGRVGAIQAFLKDIEEPVMFGDLVRGLGLAPLAVLIGLLLGSFRVEQRGEFYGQEIWVR